MDDIYWSWYTIAFILEIISIIIAFSEKYSIKAKNFSKVWIYYSFAKLNFIKWNKPWFFSNFFWIIFILLINPFFSWIMVFIIWYWFISLINEKISTPEKLKEIQYKLWASLLNEEEVKKLIRESASFMWKDIIFEDEEDDNFLIINWTNNIDDFYVTLVLYKFEKTFLIRNRYPDYDRVIESKYTYKIEENNLFIKLLERKIEGKFEKSYYEVEDWVVILSEIIDKKEESELKELEKEIEWNTNYNYKIKYYILSKHPEILPQNEFKKIIRKELERIKLWFIKISDFCKKCGVEVIYNEEWKNYYFNSINDNFDYEKFWKDLENFLENINYKKWEIEKYNEIIETLNSYLWEQKNDN